MHVEEGRGLLPPRGGEQFFTAQSFKSVLQGGDGEVAGPGEVVVTKGDLVGALAVGEVAEAKIDHLLGQGQVRKDLLKYHREYVRPGNLIIHFH